jgi:hypothetical protein
MPKCKWSNEAPKPPKRAKMLRIVVSENHSHLLLEPHSNVEADQQLQHINCQMKAFRRNITSSNILQSDLVHKRQMAGIVSK